MFLSRIYIFSFSSFFSPLSFFVSSFTLRAPPFYARIRADAYYSSRERSWNRSRSNFRHKIRHSREFDLDISRQRFLQPFSSRSKTHWTLRSKLFFEQFFHGYSNTITGESFARTRSTHRPIRRVFHVLQTDFVDWSCEIVRDRFERRTSVRQEGSLVKRYRHRSLR